MQVRFKIKPTKRAAMRLGALALTLPMALGSCAGTGVTAEETAAFGAVRASMVDYKSGQALSLVNETYAERNAGQAVDAGTKVSTDEVVAELAKFFAEEGFWDHARPGEPAAVGALPQVPRRVHRHPAVHRPRASFSDVLKKTRVWPQGQLFY